MPSLETAQWLGSIGEFLGSIAVLVTLVYLAIQTRHARAANEANIQWQGANASRDLATMWATSPQAVELLAEFGQPDSRIPDVDAGFDPRFFRYIKINQSIMETLQANLVTSLSDEDRDLAVARVRQTINMPGFRATWPRLKSLQVFRGDFVTLVERVLGETSRSGQSDHG
jgi:hypothetical protein